MSGLGLQGVNAGTHDVAKVVATVAGLIQESQPYYSRLSGDYFEARVGTDYPVDREHGECQVSGTVNYVYMERLQDLQCLR